MNGEELRRRISRIDFKRVMDQSEDGYMITDEGGIVLYHNDAYIKMVQIAPPMVGKPMQGYIEDGTIERSVALMALQSRRRVLRSNVVHRNIPYLATSALIYDGAGAVVGSVTNIRSQSDIDLMRDEIARSEQYMRSLEKALAGTNQTGACVIAVSPMMQRVFAMADKIKNMDTTVMLRGESGVGKEVVARYIHEEGNRRARPFIAVNCGAISENLLESELFGYVGGSFTGASKCGKKGLIEAAEGGILFLDEIGDISPQMQVKLLRVLENRTFVKVGDQREIPFDVQIVSATNKDLDALVRSGAYREDLFYRLNVIPITIPPLRDRREDIAPLCLYYLKRYNEKYGLQKTLAPDAMEVLVTLDWPGNVRQLKNMVERLVATSPEDQICPEHLALQGSERYAGDPGPDGDGAVEVRRVIPLEDAIAETERQLLQKARAQYRSCRKMSAALGVDFSTVARKLKYYGLT